MSWTGANMVRGIILLFYAVGVAGMVMPFSQPLFRELIPWTLLLNAFLLFFFRWPRQSVVAWSVLAFIALSGYGVEVLGVSTGHVFGSYTYGHTLGIQWAGVPLIIGVNWLVLTLTASDLVSRLNVSGWLQLLLGAMLLVILDVFLEQVAPLLDMWHWAGQQIPLQNYLAWYLLSLIFMALIRWGGVSLRSPLSAVLFFSQLFFFVILSLILP